MKNESFFVLNGHDYLGELLFAAVFILAALVIVVKWGAGKFRLFKQWFKKQL